MKRQIMATFMAIVLCLTGLTGGRLDVKAEGESEDVDISNLLTDDALIGYAECQTRGIYLVGGYSTINKISSTKVGAGGATEAALRCSVRVSSFLEKKVSGSWERVASWSQTNNNALSAMISKTVTVSSGYYYRVRGNHYAASDVTSSWTDALWVN